MSYDLRIWCLGELPESETGTVETGRDWVINVSCSARLETDLPDELVKLYEKLGGIRFVLDVSLEPTDSPPEGMTALWKTARSLAETVQGVIEDPQEGFFETPLGVAPSRNVHFESDRRLKKPKRRGYTRAEVEARLNANPERVARRAKRREEHEKLVAELKRASAPLKNDLQAAGYNVDFVSALHTMAPYPRAVPILADHLARPYPLRVRIAIAHLLGVPEARPVWNVLVQLYRLESEKLLKEALAAAIGRVADDKVLGDVVELVRNTEHGQSRILLLNALERSPDPRALATLFELQTDPDLMKSIGLVLRRLKRTKG